MCGCGIEDVVCSTEARAVPLQPLHVFHFHASHSLSHSQPFITNCSMWSTAKPPSASMPRVPFDLAGLSIGDGGDVDVVPAGAGTSSLAPLPLKSGAPPPPQTF